jgi:hypothetical protein
MGWGGNERKLWIRYLSNKHNSNFKSNFHCKRKEFRYTSKTESIIWFEVFSGFSLDSMINLTNSFSSNHSKEWVSFIDFSHSYNLSNLLSSSVPLFLTNCLLFKCISSSEINKNISGPPSICNQVFPKMYTQICLARISQN